MARRRATDWCAGSTVGAVAKKADLSPDAFAFIMVAIGLMLCCGVPGGAYYTYQRDKKDEVGIRAAGDAYLAAVVGGDLGTAYDLLCEADRKQESRERWMNRAPLDPAPAGYRIIDVTFEYSAESPTYRWVVAEISYSGRPSREVRILVQPHDSAWKICNPPLP